jgi:predicted amidophosphoribosyltransferase
MTNPPPDFLKGLFSKPPHDGWRKCPRCDKAFLFVRETVKVCPHCGDPVAFGKVEVK